jgi:hypothetical protein
MLAAGYTRQLILACDSKGWSLDLPFQPTPRVCRELVICTSFTGGTFFLNGSESAAF